MSLSIGDEQMEQVEQEKVSEEEALQTNLKKPMSGECRYQYDRLLAFQKLKDKATSVVQRAAEMLAQGKYKNDQAKEKINMTHTNTKLKLDKISSDTTQLKEKMVKLGCPGVTI